VVVDVLRVGDLDAVLLLELVERRVTPARLVVDVERPVREMKRLRELVTRRRPGLGLRRAPARREQAGDREHGAAGCGALQKLPAGQLIGHAAPSIGSTTNVASGSQLSARRSPGACGTLPGRSLRTTTVMLPLRVSTMYWVETPMYARSLTTPWSWFASCASGRIFSGRMPTATLSLRPRRDSAGTRKVVPSSSRTPS